MLAHHLEGHMSGDGLYAGLLQRLLDVLDGHILIVLGKLHAGVAHLGRGLYLLHSGEIAVMAEGIEL